MKVNTIGYTIQSEKLPKEFDGFRIAVLSDLHDTVHGKGNSELLKKIEQENPDIVIIAGDLITGLKGRNYAPAVNLVRNLSERFPVYYGMGNHEARKYENIKKYLEEIKSISNLYLLDNSSIRIERSINGTEKKSAMIIAGISLDSFHYSKRRKLTMKEGYMAEKLGKKKDEFTVLIAHHPDYFKDYTEWGADIIFSGHLHGGLVRLPLLGGVLSPQIKLFPKYDKGIFTEGQSVMIVSAGLGTHTIPRVFNPPELIIAEILAIEKKSDF